MQPFRSSNPTQRGSVVKERPSLFVALHLALLSGSFLALLGVGVATPLPLERLPHTEVGASAALHSNKSFLSRVTVADSEIVPATWYSEQCATTGSTQTTFTAQKSRDNPADAYPETHVPNNVRTGTEVAHERWVL